MKIYGIQNKETGALLGVSTFSNEGIEFCNPVGSRFKYVADGNVYCGGDASMDLVSDPDWYNSSTLRPQWPPRFNSKNWQVVQLYSGPVSV
jgi:hypothetical protein